MLPYVPNFKPSGRRATGGRRLVLTGRTSHHLHPGQRSSQPWWLEPTDSQKPHISLHSRNLRENSSLLQVASYLTTSQWRVGDAVWHRDKPFGSQGLVFDEFWNLRAGVSRESSRWNPGLWQTNRYNCGVLFAVGNLVSHLAFTQTCPFGVYPNIFWESDNVSITQPQVTSSPHGFLFTGSQAGPLGQLEAILMMLESSKSMQRSTSCNLKNGCSLLKKSTHILTGSNLAVYRPCRDLFHPVSLFPNNFFLCNPLSWMPNSSQNPCKSGLLNLFNSCDAMVQH